MLSLQPQFSTQIILESSMRVLVVQNFDGTGLGQLQTALDEAGAGVSIVRPHHGEKLPQDHSAYDGLIVLGGGQNALADEAHPYFPQLLSMMKQFAASDRSVLGICLGSQLLARAYEGDNIIGGASEFGWTEVTLLADGQVDPLFSDADASFPIFQWHDDTFTLPDNAVRLAGSAAVSNQAFRIGRAAYGVQFHFEADRTLVEQWSRDFHALLAHRQPDWSERQPVDAAEFGPKADATGLTIARNWVATVRPASSR
jgi:GMP synthase-like glutamine amidotransferase